MENRHSSGHLNKPWEMAELTGVEIPAQKTDTEGRWDRAFLTEAVIAYHTHIRTHIHMHTQHGSGPLTSKVLGDHKARA